MSYNNNTNSNVNPFDIDQDEGDPWDDDANEDDVYGDDNDNYDEGHFDGDNNDEQMKLMSGRGRRSKASRYNASLPADYHRRINNSRSSSDYHEGQYQMNDIRFYHRPQMWKYLFIVVPIVLIVVIYFSNDGSNSKSNNKHSKGDYISLIDEIPNDEYKIVVLGERHSGTVWMRDRIKECFPHAEVTTTLQRPTYFFQDDEQTAIAKEQRQQQHNDNGNNKPQQKNIDTIVIHVTLNVYDWLEQMRLSPEYAPDHVGTHKELGHVVPLEWKEFVTKPWTMERPSNDLPFANMTGPVCQYGFSYNEVVSCTGRQSSSSSSSSLLRTNSAAGGIGDPMYEFRRSNGGKQNDGGEEGIPYESIIDLRADKIRNHQDTFNSWPSIKKMIHVSYETTGRDFKKVILQEILDFTGWNDGKYKDDNTGVTLPCSGDVLPPSLDSSKGMTTEFVKYVSEQVDWGVEKLISQERWTKKDVVAKRIYKEKKTKPKMTTTITKSAAATTSSSKGKSDDDVEISINNKETSDKSSENGKKSTTSKDKGEISEKQSTNTEAESSSSSRSSDKDGKKNNSATDEDDSKSSIAAMATDKSSTSKKMNDSVSSTSMDKTKKKSSDTASTTAKKKQMISTTTMSSGSTKDNKKETTETETSSSSAAKVFSEGEGNKPNDKTKENKGDSLKKKVSSASPKDSFPAATDSQPTSVSSKKNSSSSSSNSGSNTKKSSKQASSSKDNEK